MYLKSSSSESSKFGFKGREDLGGRMQAFFRLVSGFNINNRAMSEPGYIFSRLAYVGVGSERYGSLTLGRQYMPYLLYVGSLGAAPVPTGAIITYLVNPEISLAGGYSYARASSANGVSDPARCRQLSFDQTYSLAKRSTIYFLEAYQRALGHTPGAAGAAGAGDIVDSVAQVGHISSSTPSSGQSQFVGMVGRPPASFLISGRCRTAYRAIDSRPPALH